MAQVRWTDGDASTDDRWFASWRRRELRRVERSAITYLDYTGAALYPESLLRRDARRLSCTLLGNPHSEHAPSRAASTDIESARRAILEFLHADPAEYTVVLTANASAACRLVGESFPFGPGGQFVLSVDNHNSVNGLREYARTQGARVTTIALDDELRLLEPLRHVEERALGGARGGGLGGALLAFPAQSNFSGVRHPLHLVDEAQRRGFRVLLDAAAYVPTADLRLDRVHPDFVALSLYKISGYPTGLGALVARHDALAELRRPAFAGGTVQWVSVQDAEHRLRVGCEAFEDGTLPFLGIGAVEPALQTVREAGRDRLPRHLESLTRELLQLLGTMTHDNGTEVIEVHGPLDTRDRGATVAVSVRDADGAVVPFWEVEQRTVESGLAVRGGCFCNPGCAERALGVPEKAPDCRRTLGDAFHVKRFADCLGDSAVGAIRISLGLGSIRADLERLRDCLEQFRNGRTPRGK